MRNKKNESIKIIPLGGVGEIGKNMYIVEVDEDIFVLDAGLMFPEDEMLGIDVVIPDTSYLEENKSRVKAIFLTHGHEDSIGALPYVLRKLNVPVYGTKLTIAFAKEAMKDQRVNGSFHVIHSDSQLTFDSVTVSFFKTTQSIPDSVGICIHTTEGNIVYTGDFKFDQAATDIYKTEIGKIANIGDEGVLCLLSDSTEAERPGYTTSESVVTEEITNAFHSAPGRVIVACFASNLIRIQQVFDVAYENNRKVAVMGKNLERVYEIALELGYLKVKDEKMIIPIQDIGKYRDDQIIVIATGHMGEPLKTLQRMAKQTHKQVNIQKGDTVLITPTPGPSLETFLYRTMDLLYRAGATVISKKIHVSEHGHQEDLKLMLNLTKPKYFVPVQGEYRMLFAHAKIAQEMNIKKKNIFIPGKGEIIEYRNGKMTTGNRVNAGNVLIDGLGVGDVGNIVLRDRKLLSEDGIFIVVVTLNKKEKRLLLDRKLFLEALYMLENRKNY